MWKRGCYVAYRCLPKFVKFSSQKSSRSQSDQGIHYSWERKHFKGLQTGSKRTTFMYVYANQATVFRLLFVHKLVINVHLHVHVCIFRVFHHCHVFRWAYVLAKYVIKRCLIFSFQILRVGVTGVRYVSLPNARSWVIHNFRDTRGRGRLQQTVLDLVRYL